LTFQECTSLLPLATDDRDVDCDQPLQIQCGAGRVNQAQSADENKIFDPGSRHCGISIYHDLMYSSSAEESYEELDCLDWSFALWNHDAGRINASAGDKQIHVELLGIGSESMFAPVLFLGNNDVEYSVLLSDNDVDVGDEPCSLTM